MNLIKKYWYFCLLATILIIVAIMYFIGKKDNNIPNESANSTENNIVLEYAKDYYNNHVNVSEIDEYKITIEMLKNAVNLQIAAYDINELNKCEDSSYAVVFLKPGETSPEKIESHFICK